MVIPVLSRSGDGAAPTQTANAANHNAGSILDNRRMEANVWNLHRTNSRKSEKPRQVVLLWPLPSDTIASQTQVHRYCYSLTASFQYSFPCAELFLQSDGCEQITPSPKVLDFLQYRQGSLACRDGLEWYYRPAFPRTLLARENWGKL